MDDTFVKFKPQLDFSRFDKDDAFDRSYKEMQEQDIDEGCPDSGSHDFVYSCIMQWFICSKCGRLADIEKKTDC